MGQIKSLGLKENAGLFSLLVLMSAFVGTMVGFERSLLPELTKDWELSSLEASLLMVAVFGASKAVANLFTGKLISDMGRKRTLILGWLIALQAPLILLHASSGWLIILANIALGLSQGFTWSTTVMMKIDIVGLAKRGTAMGLNESAGYLAVGASSFAVAYYVHENGMLAPVLYGALGIGLIATIFAVFLVPDTQPWVDLEHKLHTVLTPVKSDNIFLHTSFKEAKLRNITWAGLVNNANDGVLWAILPFLLITQGSPLTLVGWLTGIHASVWGMGQLITGPLSNKGDLKVLIISGMAIQGCSLLAIGYNPVLILPYILLGAGTAMVYPTFLVGISNNSHPSWRPKAMSAYRFWRDMGYVVGALLGFVALQFGQAHTAFYGIALLTLLTAGIFWRGYR